MSEKKKVFLWDYLRGNKTGNKVGSVFHKIAYTLDRNNPDKLNKKLTALELKQKIYRQQHMTNEEKRVDG